MNDKEKGIFFNHRIEDKGIWIGPIEFWHGERKR